MPLLLGATLFACEDETDQPLPEIVSIQFEEVAKILREDDEAITLTLTLNKAAAAAGTVELEIDAGMRSRIQTAPAHTNGLVTLPFAKGATQLQFKVNAINNAVVDGDGIARIRIKSSEKFSTGERAEFQLTLQDDDEAAPVTSLANFAEQVETISENRTESLVYTIRLSATVATDSEVEIQVSSSNAATFVTNPVAQAGKIKLHAPTGTNTLSFTLTTINDAQVSGPTDIIFTINSVTGSVVKGTHLSRELTISDDELSNKLRSYETIGAGDSEKRSYEYDVNGRISKVNWETSVGYKGTDTYYYDDQDRVIKVNKHVGRDVHYLWNNGRVERADVYQDDVLKEYANYAYDDHGNIAGVEPYYRQADGTFKRGLFVVYLYFLDGNVYKSLLYQDVAGQEEPALIRTRTYDNYLPNEAHISMVEIIPGVKSQKNLAGSYREETNGKDVTYWLTYEFNAEGLPVKRTASSSTDTQTTVYQYY